MRGVELDPIRRLLVLLGGGGAGLSRPRPRFFSEFCSFAWHL